ncbi:MAG: phosphodiester glycosidase family protein [Gammaproteobacteria bacterium]|nr:phosphodiester glycosidase family protein [Gammaproteobacteria bacterium]MDH5802834.1 phosphodiester glycosidase family protein [Gammaproteobacteria bacterium]
MMNLPVLRTLLLLSILFASYASEASQDYTVLRINTVTQDLQLFWHDDKGIPFQRFDRLASWLQKKGKKLVFAMNAGMYHADLSPVGLLVQNGVQIKSLNLTGGKGNFFLKPNGVFVVSQTGPKVVDATEYGKHSKGVIWATQSGPLLLKNGAVHPKLNPMSTSRLIRNGVGVSGREAIFVISEKPVSFYEFALYFRDVLKCENALYLDGVISGIYSDETGRNDKRASYGPIVGVTR